MWFLTVLTKTMAVVSMVVVAIVQLVIAIGMSSPAR